MYHLDYNAGRERFADMMREANENRLARKVSKRSARRPWFSRIAQFIAHFGDHTHQDASVRRGELATAKR